MLEQLDNRQRCVVRVLAERLAPYKGRVYDPCCGSAGMFVQSEMFVEEHGGRIGDIAGLRAGVQFDHAAAGDDEPGHSRHRRRPRLRERRHVPPRPAKDLKADDVMANPPFNDSDWRRSDEDLRWKYDVPPNGNANFA